MLATPLVIFPPWINRFYILDLNPKKSFIRWAVEQGLTVFIVSWKSADESMADMTLDDYVAARQIDAIDAVRELLGVESVHAIGYCVAGHDARRDARAARGAGRGGQGRERDLLHRPGRFLARRATSTCSSTTSSWQLIEQLSPTRAISTGAIWRATFNLLRGRDLIWNYVTNNYLLGEDYPPFDLLHWNGDTTNLPAKWHRAYLDAISTATTSWSSPAR